MSDFYIMYRGKNRSFSERCTIESAKILWIGKVYGPIWFKTIAEAVEKLPQIKINAQKPTNTGYYPYGKPGEGVFEIWENDGGQFSDETRIYNEEGGLKAESIFSELIEEWICGAGTPMKTEARRHDWKLANGRIKKETGPIL